jgi:hypothetical protein
MNWRSAVPIVVALLIGGTGGSLLARPRAQKGTRDGILEAVVRENADPASFELHRTDEDALMLVGAGSTRRLFGYSDLERFADARHSEISPTSLESFRVLDVSESARYGSIEYEVAWKYEAERRPLSMRAIVHEVWERQGGGWVRVFSAMDLE